MVPIRRVCLFGGPGCGKSTTAAWLFANLRFANYDVEHITEYIKFWTFIDRSPKGFDQVYVFGKQLHKEDALLRSGVSYVVTDSPILLSLYYGQKYSLPGYKHLAGVIKEFEEAYPSINIVLRRGEKKYNPKGRYQTYEEAKRCDTEIENLLKREGVEYHAVGYEDRDAILTLVKTVMPQTSLDKPVCEVKPKKSKRRPKRS